MPSMCCLHDLDTFPGFFFSPEVLGHQQIVGYQILPFWLIIRHIYLQSLSFPNSYLKVWKLICPCEMLRMFSGARQGRKFISRPGSVEDS